MYSVDEALKTLDLGLEQLAILCPTRFVGFDETNFALQMAHLGLQFCHLGECGFSPPRNRHNLHTRDYRQHLLASQKEYCA